MESEEGRKENAEIKWEKLWRVGKKKGGNSTPAASFWRANANHLHHNVGVLSSRKLAAALWEFHQYKPPLDSLRRRPPPPTSSQLPESLSTLRRRVADLLMQHHRSIETSNHATQTVSPSISSSSLEIAPCYPATPSSSVELNSELSYRSKTLRKLLKVLNRVWILEEQHASNVSLIKELKKELDRARFQAKELSREQQRGPIERLTGGILLKTNKAKVKSTRDELEQERKIRNHLAQEVYEVKRSVARISKELEKERTSRGFLEELCDELAWGVRDCEKEFHDQRQESDAYLGERGDHDQLILRIAQAWLDERMQVKQQHRKTSVESMPSARLEEDDGDGSSSSQSTCFEVEKTSKRSLKPQGQKLLENHFEKMLRIEEFKEKTKSSDRTRASTPSRLQAKFEEHMAQAMLNSTSKLINEDHVMASSLRRSSQCLVRGWTEKLPAQASETPLKLLSELKELAL
ncbi:uncharacterized protein At5g41620-like [Salvia splendens]|uniref:uncharacterized protein At5g41620-like n=1 Tax=Salvia splendens TaxID=180675 RepID=UPI001C27D651|nr:uncharacterized protein At5g41620-like [Salvia splendens]